jgi:predicted transcriptional regulator
VTPLPKSIASLTDTLPIAAEIVAAYVSSNPVKAEELPALLQSVHDCVAAIAKGASASIRGKDPAVPVSKSIGADYIICLEDGKKLRMLKRYLRTHFGLSPEEYRRKWNLPADYPMTAPDYSKKRSKLAKALGLGRVKETAPKKRGRRKTKPATAVETAPPQMIATTYKGRKILAAA